MSKIEKEKWWTNTSKNQTWGNFKQNNFRETNPCSKGLFVSVKGIIDRTNSGISNPDDGGNGAQLKFSHDT